MSAKQGMEEMFDAVTAALLGELYGDEALSIQFEGESSDFMRFNEGRVRQIGRVERSNLRFTYYSEGRTLGAAFDLSGKRDLDVRRARSALVQARVDAALLPPDPWQVLPSSTLSSNADFSGKLPDPDRIVDEVLVPAEVFADHGASGAAGRAASNVEGRAASDVEGHAAFVGLHAQGQVCRGAANNLGSRHWFSSETFCTDYSAVLPSGKAVKSSYAGRVWDGNEYSKRLSASADRLGAFRLPLKSLSPGAYRAWLAPDALCEFLAFFSGDGLGERCMREGESPFLSLRDGRRELSPRFSLRQDFGLGIEPRFNELGEFAPESLALVECGKLVGSLVSARSAKRYGVASNAAPEEETLRSPSIDPGDIAEGDVLAAIGTGLYISNLHYLNCSDNDSARVTGMTRFACFWVEDGEIVAPIRDMQFDESLYRLFGDKLVGLGRERSLVPNSETYFTRSLGGALLPGMLVEGFDFTL